MPYGVMGIAIVFSMAGAGVVVGGIVAGIGLILLAVSLRHADLWTALRWGAVYFACVIAPALVRLAHLARFTR